MPLKFATCDNCCSTFHAPDARSCWNYVRAIRSGDLTCCGTLTIHSLPISLHKD